MDRGTYSAASAGLMQLRKLDVVSHNLSNMNTPGYKKQILVNEEENFERTFAKLIEGQDPFAKPDQARTPGVVNTKEVVDFSPGPIQETSNPMDVALRNSKDFFVIQTPTGPEYTRAGNFTLDSGSRLVTADGYMVTGDGGEITATGAGVRINSNGSVQTDNSIVGRLQVVRFTDTSGLTPVGGSRFKLGPGAPQPAQVEADVTPHSLEMANVSTVASMVDIIEVSRAFEMYTKAAQSIDDMNNLAISRYGSRR